MERFIGPDRTIEEMVSRFAEASQAGELGDEIASLRPTELATLYSHLLVGSPEDQVLGFITELDNEGSAKTADSLRQILAV